MRNGNGGADAHEASQVLPSAATIAIPLDEKSVPQLQHREAQARSCRRGNKGVLFVLSVALQFQSNSKANYGILTMTRPVLPVITVQFDVDH